MKNSDLICSASRALLGRVTPNLRAVYITFEGSLIVLSFYYDQKPSEDEYELANLADTDFICAFQEDFKSDYKVHVTPVGSVIPNDGICIYYRFE